MYKRQAQDDALQATLGLRRDIPAELVDQLMTAAKNSARRRLSESLEPTLANDVDSAVERGADAIAAVSYTHLDVYKRQP